ncbi:Protein of unknown function (DUF3125) [Staphylococcus schweitzeri]|nr:Protein of unknown function (DUF3125) [Staphylococcus schweitzeri]
MIFSQNLFRRPTPARLTRIEKSLLQAHFRSVNYCQYNFVEHRTLIYVSGSYAVVAKQTTVFLLTCNFLEVEPNSSIY